MSVTWPRYFATATVNTPVQLDHDQPRAFGIVAPVDHCVQFVAARRAALRPVARLPARQPARPLASRPTAAGGLVKISRSPSSRHLAAISTCPTTRSRTSPGGSREHRQLIYRPI